MNEDTLKQLFQCKFDLAHAMINWLPEALQTPVKNAEYEVLSVVQEAIQNYLAQYKESGEGSSKDLKTIPVE